MSSERHPASADLDLLPAAEVVRIIQEADASVPELVAAARPAISQAVDGIAARLEPFDHPVTFFLSQLC